VKQHTPAHSSCLARCPAAECAPGWAGKGNNGVCMKCPPGTQVATGGPITLSQCLSCPETTVWSVEVQGECFPASRVLVTALMLLAIPAQLHSHPNPQPPAQLRNAQYTVGLFPTCSPHQPTPPLCLPIYSTSPPACPQTACAPPAPSTAGMAAASPQAGSTCPASPAAASWSIWTSTCTHARSASCALPA
jgi:hypothetical protein